MTDEPLLESDAAKQARGSNQHAPVDERIGQLLHAQRYAVLCTQGQGQPYGSLVAFAATDDLLSVVFATPVSTRKYRLLCECDHVALVVDSRSRSSGDMMNIEAVTATGRAVQVTSGAGLDDWARLLTRRHRQLDRFVESPTTALFRVNVIRYLHVSHFQEVRQWIPTIG
jgi:nitroimidazol reductase NimA-like FMN-containing flavoprotein (pyridoxamine 5'-phosphate oxidase superfamily)